MDEPQEVRWGTWEELVLGSAVNRHGTNSWDLVSRELQLRSISPYVFSPEACKAKYVALQGRFSGCKNSAHNNNSIMSLLEELRRLRVAQLKMELQRSNDSIGSLQSKLEKLKAERESESVPLQPNNGRSSERARQRGEISDGGEPDERSKDRSSAGSFTEGLQAAETAPRRPPAQERIRNGCEIGIERAQTGRADGELNSVLKDGEGKPSAPVGGSAGEPASARLDGRGGEEKKAPGDWASDDAPAPSPRTDAYLLQQVPKLPTSEVQPSSPLDSFYGSSETLADEREQKRSHRNFGESKNSDVEGCQAGAKTEGMEGLRAKQQPARRPRTNHSRHVLISHRPRAEDLDSSKREETANRAASETGNARDSRPDETACLGIFAKSETDQISIGALDCTEDSEMHTADTNVSERSSEPIKRRRRRRGRRKRSKGSSFKATDVHSETSRSRHKEMVSGTPMKGRAVEEGSAESTEIKEEGQKGAWREGLPGESDVLSSANPAELSARQDGKGFSTSHEVSGGISRGHYKECEDYLDPWIQTTRSSGDSHIDLGESQMEGTEEMSPMSKRSRREPKVAGKLLPLLKCLRAITSHKFGYLFKHRLESQNTSQYRSVIRRHMDLGMIRSKLEEGSYACSLEFFRDILLVFNNALIYYPKGCQEFAAAWVLRQLATKEMANIFQTEALLKQEGPSTRKREPRKALESASTFRFNPTAVGVGRKRNARPSAGGRAVRPSAGGRAVGRPKSARLTSEQSSAGVHQKSGTQKHQQQAENETDEIIKEGKIEGDMKESIAASLFIPLKPNPEGERDQKSGATDVRNVKDGSIIAAEVAATKTSGNNHPLPKKIPGIGIDPPKGFSGESRKVFDSAVDPRASSTNSAIVEPRKIPIDRGNRAGKKEHHGNPTSETLLPLPNQEPALQTRTNELAPPVKRGVGRPPKHAQRGAQKHPTPVTPKAGADSETPSKSRKRARR